VTGKPARTYSIGFEAQGYDEMGYARIAARHFGTRHHEYYVTPADIVTAVPKIAEVYDQPFGNSSVVPTYFCAKLAREDGIDTLLGGDGGDELFGGNVRYAKQHLYSLYSDLPLPLRKGLIEPSRFFHPRSGSWQGAAVHPQRVAAHAGAVRKLQSARAARPANVFAPEFLASVDETGPRKLQAQAYDSAHAQSLINRMLAFDLRFTLADNDLPKVARACELAGLSVRFPLLDDPVVAFSATLPPRLKLGHPVAVLLQGSAARLPARRDHHQDQARLRLAHRPLAAEPPPLRQLALDSLADLKKRGIVRAEFIDELTSTHVAAHAGYYGTMVWVLMMLEQWFQRRSLVV